MATEIPQKLIADRLGIPQQTIATWGTNAGLRRQSAQSIANRVKAHVSKAIETVATNATVRIEALLEQSHEFGTEVLNKARLMVNSADAGELVSVANAGKVGVGIARQALGLDVEGATTNRISIQKMTILSRSADTLLELEPAATDQQVVSPHQLSSES